jgi:CRP/FNR family transcriptional regulator, cyclic AMP receptor protein
MLNRFQGNRGHTLLVDTLTGAKLFAGNRAAAEAAAASGKLTEFDAGSSLIEQGDFTNDVFFILVGSCSVVVNGRQVGRRGPGDQVGEMAAIQPTQARSASVIAVERTVALQITEEDFSALAEKFPQTYKLVAQELARRLLARNSLIGSYREKIKVFIISSAEALPVARIVEDAFQHDDFEVHLWSAGCFKVANYTLEDLEREVDNSDFAIAIAHADDVLSSRGTDNWPAPRDNVIFELGLFMGRLGRSRAILMEPRGAGVKLPSDLAGITTITYRYEKGGENHRLMGPAANRLREHIAALGPNNG